MVGSVLRSRTPEPGGRDFLKGWRQHFAFRRWGFAIRRLGFAIRRLSRINSLESPPTPWVASFAADSPSENK
jgi:hypothetical protein